VRRALRGGTGPSGGLSVSHLAGLVVGEVVVTQPDAQRRPLELGSHQSVELQSRAQTGAFLALELHLHSEHVVRGGAGDLVYLSLSP